MRYNRFALAVVLTIPLALAVSACGGGTPAPASSAASAPSSAAAPTATAGATITLMDGFTQYNTGNSPWEQSLNICQQKLGVKLERNVVQDSLGQFTQVVAAGQAPDLFVLDNPEVARFAETGVLVDNATSGVDTSKVMPNILASGVTGGKTYGAPIGSNTLALYYNTELFKAAGLNPPTNWAEIKDDAAKLTDKAKGQYGIAFSARPDAEGTFQFLPFFWGAGAKLTDIGSPEAIDALTFWVDLVKAGYASKELVTLNQQEVRDQFMAGHAAMMVNGTWQLNTLDDAKTPYAVVPIPAKNGGPAAAPLGGEFITVVKSDDPARVSAAGAFVNCVVSPENLSAFLTGQTYISPYADQAAQQAASDPRLVPWVPAVAAAQARTADLGSKYPTVATKLGEALSGSVAGQSEPAAALQAAAAAVK